MGEWGLQGLLCKNTAGAHVRAWSEAWGSAQCRPGQGKELPPWYGWVKQKKRWPWGGGHTSPRLSQAHSPSPPWQIRSNEGPARVEHGWELQVQEDRPLRAAWRRPNTEGTDVMSSLCKAALPQRGCLGVTWATRKTQLQLNSRPEKRTQAPHSGPWTRQVPKPSRLSYHLRQPLLS